MRERNWWETPTGSECDSDLISGKNSPKPKKARKFPVKGRIPPPEFAQDRGLSPEQNFDTRGNNPQTNGYFNNRGYSNQNRPNQNRQHYQGGYPANSQNY